MSKWILVAVSVAVLGAVLVYAFHMKSDNATGPVMTAEELEKFPDLAIGIQDCPSKGPEHGRVTIVEFTDFQCPFCNRANNTMNDLVKEFKDDLKLHVCMHPLSFHPRATPGGIAAYAAHRQGKYWEYHQKCFDNNKELEDADLRRYAEEVGLDMAQWEKDIQDPVLAAAVRRHHLMAEALGQTGAPAFFLNGELMVGAQPIEKFREVIQRHIDRAKKLEARGVPLSKIHSILSWNAEDGAYKRVILYAAADPKKKADPPPLDPQARRIEPLDSPRSGTGNKVVITLFCDFQCPFCDRIADPMRQVLTHFGPDASLVFKHLPLSFHKEAHKAAQASFAAQQQGKFWEYYDLLFQRQADLKQDQTLYEIAEQLQLDMDRFRKDLDSKRFEQRVDDDLRLANQLSANGTPTFFINGRRWQGSDRSPETIIKVATEEFLK